MAESQRHKVTKNREAGATGSTECSVSPSNPSDRRRLDACGPTRKRVKEVVTSPDPSNFRRAARNLRDAEGANQRVMIVPTKKDFPKAVRAMKEAGVGGTIRTPRGSVTTVRKPRT